MALLLVVLVPAAGRAVTLDDIVALSQQGLASSVIVAVIDADRTVFSLSPQQVGELKKQGVSDDVIVKMLGSAREYAVPAEVAPEVVIIGETPPVPTPPPLAPAVVVPYAVGVPVFVVPHRHRALVAPPVPVPVAPVTVPAPPITGFGRFMTNGWIDGAGFGRFITQPGAGQH